MGIQYKAVGVAHVEQVKDEGDGIVSAFVSVTGIEDNVKDVILPGAYEKTLQRRTPKGAWGHDWKTPTAKTLEAKELMPGDADLPAQLANGEPWPAEAGALRIKMQFNLDTQRGKEAYADVVFFGDQQEWSIGYKVHDGKSYKKNGLRYIKELDLFEYSPVLFGAMSHARTTSSVKDAQFALMQRKGIDIDSLVEELLQFKSDFDFGGDDREEFKGGDGRYTEPEDDEDDDEEDDEDAVEDEEDEDEPKALDPSLVREAIKSLEALLNGPGEGKSYGFIRQTGYAAYVEAKATEFDSLEDAVGAMDVAIAKADLEALQGAAKAFDDAIAGEDTDGAESAAVDALAMLEKVIESDDEGADSARAAARVVADRLEALDSEGEGGEPEEGKTLWYDDDGNEFKSISHGSREFGIPITDEDGVVLSGKELRAAYIGTLDNDALLSLDFMLKNEIVDPELKTAVRAEIAERVGSGDLTAEEKASFGQVGRGGGTQRQRAEGRGPGQSDRARKLPKKPGKRKKGSDNDKPLRKPGLGRVHPDPMRTAGKKSEPEETIVVDLTELKSLEELVADTTPDDGRYVL